MPLVLLLSVSFILRLWYVIQPSPVWWDTAIYASMGKFFFSGGMLGFWETLRPPLFPIILGLAWKMGIDPIFFGKLLMVASSLGLIALIYSIGETIKKNAGLAAAALTSFTFVFFSFTIVPLTDIPSAFTSLLAIWLVLRKKYFLGGLAATATFFLRFPLGLIFIPIGILAFIDEGTWRKKFIDALKISSSFIVSFGGYLILNNWLYGDPLLPIKLGQISMQQSVYTPEPFFYYAIKLFFENPLLIFALVFVGILIIKRDLLKHQTVTATLISLFLIGGYLSSLAHKELRYSIAFLPYIAILAGAGMAYVFEKIRLNKTYAILLIAAAVPVLSSIAMHYNYAPPQIASEYEKYYHFFDDKKDSIVITTSPQIGATTDIPILELFDTFEEGVRTFSANRNIIDYAAIDSCNIRCEKEGADCSPSQRQLEAELKTAHPIFDETAGECQLTIYEL